MWERCGLTRPWNDPGRDVDRKLAHDPDGLLIGCLDGDVVASAMAGYDGHRGWVNYLAVDPRHRRRGHGAAMMAAAVDRLAALGCAKVNVQVRLDGDAEAFYRSVGFEPDAVTSLGRRLVDDREPPVTDR